MDRKQIAEQIGQRLSEDVPARRAEFAQPGRIRTFVVDGLLEEGLARRIHTAFPPLDSMMHRSSLREDKYVATQMDRFDPILEECLFAFQEPGVVAAVGAITGIDELLGDPRLYAGGISAMSQGQFLNPHIDNSHQEDRASYRVLNLLYYTTPGWSDTDGGHLQVWDQGRRRAPRTLHSRFNRLVVMATSTGSWHSVNPVMRDATRTCVSNYYFSPRPISDDGEVLDRDYFHVTTFRGFPGQAGRNALLVADGLARAGLRRVFRHGLAKTSQVYEHGDRR